MGWSLFGVMWTVALAGCFFEAFCLGTWASVTTLLYVVMGWLVVIAIKTTIQAVPAAALVLMMIGGIAYTSGVVFYLWERLPFSHSIWHCFVLAGSVAHFFAVFLYIAMTG